MLLHLRAGFQPGSPPPENDQVVNRGRVVIRRVRRAGQVLAVQVWHRRAAQLERRLLDLGLCSFKFVLLKVYPDEAVTRGVLRHAIHKTQAGIGKFNNLRDSSLFYRLQGWFVPLNQLIPALAAPFLGASAPLLLQLAGCVDANVNSRDRPGLPALGC